MENEDLECCGTCRWHRKDGGSDDWYCGNEDSWNYIDFTDYDDGCIDYEPRGENE